MQRTILATAAVLALVSPLFAAKIVLVAGGGDGKDGSLATNAKLITPFGCDFDYTGLLYFVEMEKGERLRMIDSGGIVKTVAGTGQRGYKKTTDPTKATFNGMHGLAIARHPDTQLIWLADTWNKTVRCYRTERKEMLDWEIEGVLIACELTKFASTFAVSIDPELKNLVVTDLNRHQIFRFETNGLEGKLIAGNGKKGVPTDGKKAINEPLLDPRAAAMDGNGNLYILERGGHCLRVVNNAGIIRTVAGTGKAGTTIGKALESQMNGPKHCCCDKEGNVYITDAENHRILKFDPKTATVTVVAGTGKKGAAGLDGDPLKAELNRPHGVTVHPKTGELYICDSYNDRILKIVP